MGWPEGNLIDGASSQNSVLADTLVNDNIFGVYKGNSFWTVTASPSANAAVINLLNNNAGNRYYTGNAQIKLKKPFRPNTGSPALTGSNFNHAPLNDAFFTHTTYIGAVSKTVAGNWAKECWVNWRPDTVKYDNGAFGYGVGCACTVPQFAAQNPIVSLTDAASAEISPNPNKGSFNVVLKGFNTSAVNVRVADLNTGEVYFIGKAANNSTIKISIQVPNGNYVVELTDGKNIISRKVSILN
jgi:hypothetical protein